MNLILLFLNISKKAKLNSFVYNYIYLNRKMNKNKIRIGITANSIKNGGAERQTSLILHYFSKIEIFDLFLFTKKEKEENEYKININTKF